MTGDLRERLQAGFSESYSIEHELGGGGMARVFVATDRALGRRVVIKILSPELAADVSARRFEREIQLAASLQQANIVPVLSAGETDGLPHYTMPFVDGLSLRQRLQREGPPSIPDAVGILRDVARALAYAHERGVVHRDIKPENVLLSGDAAVVTDFGIAKALANARRAGDAPDVGGHPVRHPGNATITQVGVSVGTPAYMAPEQISADPSIDHRADIYAFGCLAYELMSGAPPFQAGSVHALFSAHIGETPAPLHGRNPDVPDRLAALVARCLEKDPARRPQSARDILQELQAVAPAPTGIARFVRRLDPRVRVAALTVLGLVLLGGLVTATRAIFGPDTDVPAVAVIPFVNLSGDAADEYLADGVADGLSTALGRVRGIRVASRTLGYRYRGRRDLDAHEVGRELDVAYVLHGSVQRAGSRLRVSAQLVNAEDNREVWAQSYDGAANDAFAVQDSITNLVVSSLPRRLSPGDSTELSRAARVGTTNAQAYDLYLRGRYLLQRRGAGVRQAIDYFSRAIAHDSAFADAHAAYALALELLPYFERINVDSLNRIAIPAANRALAIDSTIPQAWTALGLAHQHQYGWQRSEDAHRRAVAAEPPDADAHIQYGRFLFYTRTVGEALPYFERARQLDPTSAVASGWVGHLLDLSGRVDEAWPHLRRAMDIDSTNPPSLVMIAEAHLYSGRPDSAILYAERLARVWPGWRRPAAAVLAAAGARERALELLGATQQGDDGAAAGYSGSAFAALGDSTAWFDLTERQTAQREIWPTYWSLNERALDFMRGSARFAAIVRSVGLDPRIFTRPRGGRP